MTTTHTQGPLRLGALHSTLVSDTKGPGINGYDNPAYKGFMVAESVHPENARRLAACWNACIDIPTEVLEDMTAAGITLHQKISQLGQSEVAHFERAYRLRALLRRVTQSTEWSCMELDLQDDIANALGMNKTPALPVTPLPVDIFAPPCEPTCAMDDRQPQPGGGPGYICRKCGFDMPF